MSPESTPNPTTQQALLKIIKPLTTGPAQVLFYGSALLAIIATGGAALPGVLGTLGTTIGVNVLSNMLERVARGDEVPDDEIRKAVREAIDSSGIEKLATSNEFQKAIAHVFRQFDLLKYAVQKGEFTIVSMLTDQFTQHRVILEELQSDLSIVRVQMETLSTREQSADILKLVQHIVEQLESQMTADEISRIEDTKHLRIFLASPSDLGNERDLIKKVINEFNEHGGLAEQQNITIQVLGWEQAVSGMGMAEKVILEDLKVEQWDIFIGLLWTRFGSPTGNIDSLTGLPFQSGTEEEFTLAYRAWKVNGRPRILFYRRTAPPESLDDIDPDQYRKVLAFLDKFKTAAGNPGLFTSYALPDEFERRVRQDLIKLLPRILQHHQTKHSRQAASVSSVPLDKLYTELSEIRRELAAMHKLLLSGRNEETTLNTILNTLNDESRDGPRLFSIVPVDQSGFNPKQWIREKFRLVLWCEHSRLPLPVLNGENSLKGIYEIELTREWFKQAAPFLKFMTNTLSLILPVSSAGIKLVLDDPAYKSIEDQLVFGQAVIDSTLADSEKNNGWLGGKDVTSTRFGEPIHARGASLRELHALLKAKDPGYGGLVRVMNKRQEFLWVHERFASEY